MKILLKQKNLYIEAYAYKRTKKNCIIVKTAFSSLFYKEMHINYPPTGAVHTVEKQILNENLYRDIYTYPDIVRIKETSNGKSEIKLEEMRSTENTPISGWQVAYSKNPTFKDFSKKPIFYAFPTAGIPVGNSFSSIVVTTKVKSHHKVIDTSNLEPGTVNILCFLLGKSYDTDSIKTIGTPVMFPIVDRTAIPTIYLSAIYIKD